MGTNWLTTRDQLVDVLPTPIFTKSTGGQLVDGSSGPTGRADVRGSTGSRAVSPQFDKSHGANWSTAHGDQLVEEACGTNWLMTRGQLVDGASQTGPTGQHHGGQLVEFA